MDDYEKKKEAIKKEFNTIPNYITLGRMLFTLGVLIPGLIVLGPTLTMVGLTGITALTDTLDGYIARKYNQQSLMGKFLEGISDKVFIYGICGSLMVAGVVPILSPIVLAPVLVTLIRDGIVAKKGLMSRVKNNSSNVKEITLKENFEEKKKSMESELGKKLTLVESIEILKESSVDKLYSILETARENEKNPFVVTKFAKLKMWGQSLGVLGYMMGYPLAGLTCLYGAAACALTDIFVVNSNEKKNSEKMEAVHKIIEEDMDFSDGDKSLSKPYEMSNSRENVDNYDRSDDLFTNSGKPKVLVKTLPGRYYRNV